MLRDRRGKAIIEEFTAVNCGLLPKAAARKVQNVRGGPPPGPGNEMLPAIFVSHGAPTLAIEPGPTHDFLKNLGAEMEKPAAIVVVSAHWEAVRPTLSTVAQPETIYDFYGFPRELNRLRYPAPGAVEVAARAQSLLAAAGMKAAIDPRRGLDHGAWVPLHLMYPEAGIPVTQLSVQTRAGPLHHFRLGEALRPLRKDNVLILGSGSATHNLQEIRWGRSGFAPDWVVAFQEWVADAIEQGRAEDLLDYRDLAPHAQRNHPTEEHFLPLFAAFGAATSGGNGRRIHRAHSFGVLAMDAYRFD
jgi:4,5-DOPA dioxygenase extradiol